MRMMVLAVAGLAVLPLGGCGSESGIGGSGGSLDSSLKGKSYLSTSVTENGKPKQLAPKTRIRLQFMDDGRLTADAGCNSMGANKVSTSGGKLTVDGLAITDMGCDAPRHAQDDWLAKLLQDKPTWKLDSDRLQLTQGNTTLLLQDRATAEPDLALDGTKWSVETLINGEVASHPMGSEKAYLTISGERVTGSTGCNDMQGIVSRTGDKLTFGELGTTRRACTGDAAALEKAVLGILKGEVTYSINSNRLELRSANGSGLGLTAPR
jgi:heat shock protein HslJ